MKKFWQVIKITVIAVFCMGILVGGTFTWQGWQLYRQAVEERPLAQVLAEARAQENYTRLEQLPDGAVLFQVVLGAVRQMQQDLPHTLVHCTEKLFRIELHNSDHVHGAASLFLLLASDAASRFAALRFSLACDMIIAP